jgi:hypothetical protein
MLRDSGQPLPALGSLHYLGAMAQDTYGQFA